MIRARADVLAIDSAHGHSSRVLEAVTAVKKAYPQVGLLAGNVATYEGAMALIDAGADAVKVGFGPGSICTTRIVTGAGMPQITAIAEAARAAREQGMPVIADGGIKYSGEVTKAIAAGASSVMIGSLFAGVDESPGEIILYQGRSFKTYRGMGSFTAMGLGAGERYFQSTSDIASTGVGNGRRRATRALNARTAWPSLFPKELRAASLIAGRWNPWSYQLVGGLRSGMGYLGCAPSPTCSRRRNSCAFPARACAKAMCTTSSSPAKHPTTTSNKRAQA